MYFLIPHLFNEPLASRKLLAIYVELKGPIESVVSLNKDRILIRKPLKKNFSSFLLILGVDCRTLGVLGIPLPRLC